MILMTPWNTALELRSKSKCDVCNNHWLSLEYTGIKLKQNSIFVVNPNSLNLEHCSECGIFFEVFNDYIKHMIDNHSIIQI